MGVICYGLITREGQPVQKVDLQFKWPTLKKTTSWCTLMKSLGSLQATQVDYKTFKKEKQNLSSYLLLMHVNMKLPPGAVNE